LLPARKLLEDEVVSSLKRAGYLLCAVESCTGGLVANRITNISGSSSVFWGSITPYDNAAKVLLLGVPARLIRAHGAVSPEVARSRAEKGLRKLKRGVPRARRAKLACVATTGIAGPKGGSREKPVGLCYVGLAVAGRKTIVREV